MRILCTAKAGVIIISSVAVLALGGCFSTDHFRSASDDRYGPYPQSVKDPDNFNPGYYMSVGHTDSVSAFNVIADNPDFVGVKKRYLWSDLEPVKGEYDFSEIKSDLEYLQSIGKQLWISISQTTWRSDGRPRIPRYMWNDSRYGCGKDGYFYGAFVRTSQQGGWLPCRGNPAFDERFKALFTALGKVFNNEPGFEGINLGEASTGNNPNFRNSREKMEAFKSYALAAKKAFPDKTVMQMINYAPFDLEEFAEWLLENGIATGGPDMHLDRTDISSGSDQSIAYAIHKRNHMDTPNGIDVQWDNWDNRGVQYTSRELLDAAVEHVNPWYMFWAKRDEYFHGDVVPTLDEYGPLPAVDDFRSGSDSSINR